MSDLRVGRNDPCPCGSGRKYKHCCLQRRADGAFPGFGYLPAPPIPPTARMASANGTSRRLPLEPDLPVKVFHHERRQWIDARLAEVKPGQEFIAHNRLFRVLRPKVYAEDVLLDVAKIPEADRPYDPRNWRAPKSHDVVYAFGGDGQLGEHCLLGNLNPGQRCVFQGLIYHIKAGPTPGTCTLVGHGEVDRRRRAPAPHVWVEYTAQDAGGTAEIGYRYPLGRLIPLAEGDAVPVEALLPGMQFLLEGSGVATVTKVDPPQPWPPPGAAPDAEPDCFGSAPRHVVGTFRYTGWVELVEMTAGGVVHRVSPGHLYWSETRRGWYPIGSFGVGELLRTRTNRFLAVESITPPRSQYTTVYNLEVDEYHTYFVGGEEGVWAHNGLGEVGCGVPKAARAESGKLTSAGRVGLSEEPKLAAGWEAIFGKGKRTVVEVPGPNPNKLVGRRVTVPTEGEGGVYQGPKEGKTKTGSTDNFGERYTKKPEEYDFEIEIEYPQTVKGKPAGVDDSAYRWTARRQRRFDEEYIDRTLPTEQRYRDPVHPERPVKPDKWRRFRHIFGYRDVPENFGYE